MQMDSTYAPQSPDLSSFLSSPSKSQHPHQPSHSQSTAAYAPQSPVIPSFNNPAIAAPTSQHNPYNNNHQHPFAGGYGGGGGGGGGGFQPDSNFEFDAYRTTQYMPDIPALPPQHSFAQQQQPINPQYFYQQQQTLEPQSIPTFQIPNSYTQSAGELFSPSTNMTSLQPRGGNGGLAPTQPPIPQTHPIPQQYKDPNPHNIEIKTKFPVARIKRIMQADEEVGKVAQVTPVAVSKALELFMIALVTGAAEKAKEKGGKRVTAQHLKQVVLGSPEQFDFLAEIVGRVAEVTEGAGGESRKRKDKNNSAKGEEGSESSEEEQKKKKGKGRRKKSDD